jgi:hypothetical protein
MSFISELEERMKADRDKSNNVFHVEGSNNFRENKTERMIAL